MPGRQVSAKSRLGEAIRHTLPRWEDLIHLLDVGRIDLNNNAVECTTRPVALNRTNALFAGSDEGGDNWAVIATLTSLAHDHTASRLYEPLPHAGVA